MIVDLIACILARPAVADWLIDRAKRTPYSHFPSNDDPSYMERYWLFNPYPASKRRWHWRNLLPSVRVHRIVRRDLDDHMHDHPWDARTFILRGYYYETRWWQDYPKGPRFTGYAVRIPGETATLKFGEYHKITDVSENGVWTLFVTYRYRGTWGFMVNGEKVPHKEYLK